MKTHELEIHLSPVDREMIYRQLREAANDLSAIFAGHKFPPHILDPLVLVNQPLQQGNPTSPARADTHALVIADGVMGFVRALSTDYMGALFLSTMASAVENKIAKLAQVEQMALKLERARLLAHAVLLIADVENDGFLESRVSAVLLARLEWAPGIPRTD